MRESWRGSWKPRHPERHGSFMAEAYGESPRMGQLAVSYVVRHYCRGANDLLMPRKPLRQGEIDAMLRLKEDLSIAEEARQFGLSYNAVAGGRQRFYRKAGIPGSVAGRLAAMRLAVENDFFPVAADAEGRLSDKCSSYDIATFDLLARGVHLRRTCRLMGSDYEIAVNDILPRVVSALGLEPQRRALGVLQMYAIGFFEKGLIRRLDDFPDTLETFNQLLGPNCPLSGKA